MPTTENSRRNVQVPLPPTDARIRARVEAGPESESFSPGANEPAAVAFDPMGRTLPAEAPAEADADGVGDGNRMNIRGSTNQDPNDVSIDDSNQHDFGGPFVDPLRARPRPEGED